MDNIGLLPGWMAVGFLLNVVLTYLTRIDFSPVVRFFASSVIVLKYFLWNQDKVTIKLQKFTDRRKYADLEGTFLYKQMSDLTYERSKHSRIATAILISPFALFSKRKHHWFSWNYVNDDGKKSSVLLRIDKKEEKVYRRQVPNLTELELKEIIE